MYGIHTPASLQYQVLLHKWLLPSNFRDLMKTSVFNESSIVFTNLYLDMVHNVILWLYDSQYIMTKIETSHDPMCE